MLCLAGGGCATVHAPNLNILTPQVEMFAEDGSFRVAVERPIPTPFESEFCNAFDPRQIGTQRWREALAEGARRVVVQHPGVEKPLFGVLKLCALRGNVRGPWLREYLIQVPQSYVDETTASRVSVVYEIYPPSTKNGGYAWILWLARSPFESGPSGGVSPAPPPAQGAVAPAIAPAAPSAPGLLIIVSAPPGADIVLDGRAAGKAPLRLEVLPGDHLVEGTWPDGSKQSAVTSAAAGTSSVVRLKPGDPK